MNPERCNYMAGDELIQIVPRFNGGPLHLVCGDVDALEAGVRCLVPLWVAVLLRKRHNCQIVPPIWMCVDELRKYAVVEGETAGLSVLPHCFFEIAHILALEAKEDLVDGEQLKTLIQDIWDRREAKLRSSSMKFLSQHSASHAQMDHVQPVEVASSGLKATLSACRHVARFVDKAQNFQD